jgi:hypothetical protein
MIQARLFSAPSVWQLAHKAHPDCAALADRHYSRRKVGSPQFMPPGQTIVLGAPNAVFGWWRPEPGVMAINGLDGWTCTIFRNESDLLSSALILAAEAFIVECGPDGLMTYIHDRKIRSVNPGCCFKMAGWRTARKPDGTVRRSADGRKTMLHKPWRGKAGR